ncbi:hypothetical protein Tsubulata_005153 [Turnera subulata]|uniref:Cytochrome P450 n=1 Tax=Turnera subulata TaxID=218843 RepID=A0A9Q0JLZ4_9ROSI|nr:hypothetical protein Tsubulata_005153 [Turnera subulata]
MKHYLGKISFSSSARKVGRATPDPSSDNKRCCIIKIHSAYTLTVSCFGAGDDPRRYRDQCLNHGVAMLPKAIEELDTQVGQDYLVKESDIPKLPYLQRIISEKFRRPSLWDDPTRCKPERFGSGRVETYKLMPFGLGRRACPGDGLATLVISLTMASSTQCFDRKRVSENRIDMTEKTKLTMSKLEPLEAMCRPRLNLYKL